MVAVAVVCLAWTTTTTTTTTMSGASRRAVDCRDGSGDYASLSTLSAPATIATTYYDDVQPAAAADDYNLYEKGDMCFTGGADAHYSNMPTMSAEPCGSGYANLGAAATASNYQRQPPPSAPAASAYRDIDLGAR
mmetsp:Transcript_22602/g.55217  ORF Transcript_22602/g.55217 Transcript_22602/m.55217 type:complete len:135 (+) Transcript_22602:304-708(+)